MDEWLTFVRASDRRVALSTSLLRVLGLWSSFWSSCSSSILPLNIAVCLLRRFRRTTANMPIAQRPSAGGDEWYSRQFPTISVHSLFLSTFSSACHTDENYEFDQLDCSCKLLCLLFDMTPSASSAVEPGPFCFTSAHPHVIILTSRPSVVITRRASHHTSSSPVRNAAITSNSLLRRLGGDN